MRMLCFEASIIIVPQTRILVCFEACSIAGEGSRVRWRISVCTLISSTEGSTGIPRRRLSCDDESVLWVQAELSRRVFDIEQRFTEVCKAIKVCAIVEVFKHVLAITLMLSVTSLVDRRWGSVIPQVLRFFPGP